MADKLSKKHRSWNMSRIKGKNTKPELAVRKELYKLGYRYRINYRMEGKPDIIFVSKKIAVFIQGCFWHQHGCKDTYRPKSNKKFWNTKLDRNIQRDKEVKKTLKKQGWRIFYIWECEIKNDLDSVINSLMKIIDEKGNNTSPCFHI